MSWKRFHTQCANLDKFNRLSRLLQNPIMHTIYAKITLHPFIAIIMNSTKE